jgi:hypothetical protein
VTTKQLRVVESLIRDLTERFDQIERRSDRMELILTLKDPGSTAAADAYDGLRKQVIAAATDRLAHLTQLVQFDAAIRNRASLEVLSSMAQGWLDSSGLATVTDPDHEQHDLIFEVVENLEGAPEVLEPAYVDTQSNRVIRRGRIRYGAPVPLDPPGEIAEPDILPELNVVESAAQESLGHNERVTE